MSQLPIVIKRLMLVLGILSPFESAITSLQVFQRLAHEQFFCPGTETQEELAQQLSANLEGSYVPSTDEVSSTYSLLL